METKVEASDNREYIEEMLRDGIALRTISDRLKTVYNEDISRSALARYRDKYVTPDTEGKKVGTENKQAGQDKSVTPDAPDQVSEMDALKARIKNLELVLWKYMILDGSETAWIGYTIDGAQHHDLPRRDILLAAMPDPENLGAQYTALVSSVIKKQRAESGEEAHDIFVREREEIKQKHSEEIAAALEESNRKIAEEEANVTKLVSQKGLSPARILEMAENDRLAAIWLKDKEEKEAIEAEELKKKAELDDVEAEHEAMINEVVTE